MTTDNRPMSKRQEDLLVFIHQFIKKHSSSPTVRAMQTGLGWKSNSLVRYHLARLETSGYVTRDIALAANITPIDK